MNSLLFLKTFIKARWFAPKTEEALLFRQEKLWQEQIAFMQKESPYFREHGFSEVFLMDKAFMMENFDQLNTVGMTKDKAFALAQQEEESRQFTQHEAGLAVGLSSGTSGNRGIFLTQEKERVIWAATILAKVLPQGKLFPHKIAFFLRADNKLYQTVDSPLLSLAYFDMERDLSTHIQRLNDLQPSILVAPASVLLQLAHLQSKNQLSLAPQKVISVAEILEDGDRKVIQAAFKQEVIHQIYQATEGFLGYTCPQGTLHLNEDALIIGQEWLDDKRFYPIITDLLRKSQPIINYRLNDILQIKEETCPCGSPFMAIEKIEGRSDDLFFGEKRDGNVALIYPDFIRRCFLQSGFEGDYQVRQLSLDQLDLGLSHFDKKEDLEQAFQSLAALQEFKPFTLQFSAYSKPQKQKLRRIIQAMPKEKVKECYEKSIN
ncbi:F390 synthetase-related protein [Streptococcus porcinus]|uniref:F390 synthetase-related protein n=1 Tax=Streptococcus porcinus TaxID=1340 RepID=UPI0019620B34|nr:F390 synthetase-related protein [Streptococcus porcinus]